MDLKIGKIHDKVLVDKDYITLDQKFNMINKLYAFTKTEKDIEHEPVNVPQKNTEQYIEQRHRINPEMLSLLPNTISFLDKFDNNSTITEEILQYINFDDATDDFITLYLNQVGSLNPITITTILLGMLDAIHKHPNLMSTLGNFLRKQYIKNHEEYPNFLKLVHKKVHDKKLYDNIDVASKWDEFFNVT